MRHHQPSSRDLIGACSIQTRRSAVRAARLVRPSTGPESKKGGKDKMAQADAARITVGVDTHKDEHVAAAKDGAGRPLGEISVPTALKGYRELLAWSLSMGEVEAFGVEGTGSYGKALARFLRSEGQVVIEVNRPDRAARRSNGKSDPIDARAAARAVQSGDASATPKAGDDRVEMIRVLRVARTSAVKAHVQAVNALKALVVTAPDELREQLRSLPSDQLVATAGRMRPAEITHLEAASKLSLRSLAQRCQALDGEIAGLDVHLDRLTAAVGPKLRAMFGVGPEVAGALLVTAGGNPARLASEGSFANLCGVSPIEASSGKTKRHRLNRGGDRQANSALYRVVVVRLRYDRRTQEYMARRTTEGKSKAEIIRCLKRYVAREVFAVLAEISTPAAA
jgi:transposase